MNQYLYHGSIHKLNVGDFLVPNTNFDSNTTKLLHGVFATTKLDLAKYFGIINCVRKSGRSKKVGTKIYLENPRSEILNKFYVYTVKKDNFVPDARHEYICQNRVQIITATEYDLITELEKGNWQIFITPALDNTLSEQEKIIQMNQFIESGNIKKLGLKNPKI